MRKLAVHREGALGMRETSGLAVRGGRLLAAGDEDFTIASVDAGSLGDPRRDDLAPALGEAGIELHGGSGFEGLACDADGTLVLLQEEQARLLVLAPDLARLVTACALHVPSGLGLGWHRQNSRGEGLLLLEQGHVLVAKERDDPCLIEFGPPGDAPVGVGTGTVLGAAGRFRPPQAVVVPLAVWPLAASALPTVNDLALGPDGRVYALSGESQVVARLERRLVPGERAGVSDAWWIGDGIPGGRAARPEGLAFLPSGRPAVGIDTKQAGNNLVVLERPGDP